MRCLFIKREKETCGGKEKSLRPQVVLFIERLFGMISKISDIILNIVPNGVDIILLNEYNFLIIFGGGQDNLPLRRGV